MIPTQAPAQGAPLEDRTANPDRFKAAFRHHPAGVAVVTADAGSGPVGLTATSVFSVSADPPVFAFSVSELSSSTPTILKAESVVVHLLDRGRLDLAVLCATSGIDRFADTSKWARLETGEPYFTSAPVWIRGKTIERIPIGKSTLIVVESLEISAAESNGDAHRHPLVYHDRTWHRLSGDSALDE